MGAMGWHLDALPVRFNGLFVDLNNADKFTRRAHTWVLNDEASTAMQTEV